MKWFDAHAKLAEIAGETPATSATTATKAPKPHPVSRESRLSQGPENQQTVHHVANVATVAASPPSASPYGQSPGGRLLTWTGRVVSPEAWHDLSEWERHGPNGKHWNGITRRWEPP